MLVDKLFNYENEFGLPIIIKNFLLVLGKAKLEKIEEFLSVVNEKEINEITVNLEQVCRDLSKKSNTEDNKVLKSINKEHFKDKETVFENEHIARIYYYLPINDNPLSEEVATAIISFHIVLLKKIYSFFIEKEDTQHQNKVRYFIRMIEIIMAADSEMGMTISVDTFIKYLIDNDFSESETRYDKDSAYSIVLFEQKFYVKTQLSTSASNMLATLKQDSKSFSDFMYQDKDKKRRSKERDTNWIDTTEKNAVLLGQDANNVKVRSSVQINNRKPDEQITNGDEKFEEDSKKEEYLRSVEAMSHKNSAQRQRRKVVAVSASIEKNKARLPSLATHPDLGNTSEFLIYLLDGDTFKKEHHFYRLFFVMTLLIGMTSEKAWKALFDENEIDSIRLKINLDYYAKFDAQDPTMAISTDIYINYKLPFLLLHVRKKLKAHKPPELDKELFKEIINIYASSFKKRLVISWANIWDTSLTHRYLLDPSSDIDILLATQNIDQNASPRVAYTLVDAQLPEYSQWLCDYIEVLRLQKPLEEVLFGKKPSEKASKSATDIFTVEKYVGSKKLLKTQEVQKFFKQLENSIFFANGLKRLNLVAIYVRFAVSFVLGTRDFAKSVDFSTISYSKNVFLIHEKSTSTQNGYRIIPIPKVLMDLLHTYFTLAEQYGYHEKRIILGFENNKFEDCTLSTMNRFFKNENSFAGFKDLDKKRSAIALNVGRHHMTTAMHNAGMSLEDLRAFMGHATSGDALLGIYSAHNTKLSLQTLRATQNEMVLVYGIGDLTHVV